MSNCAQSAGHVTCNIMLCNNSFIECKLLMVETVTRRYSKCFSPSAGKFSLEATGKLMKRQAVVIGRVIGTVFQAEGPIMKKLRRPNVTAHEFGTHRSPFTVERRCRRPENCRPKCNRYKQTIAVDKSFTQTIPVVRHHQHLQDAQVDLRHL